MTMVMVKRSRGRPIISMFTSTRSVETNISRLPELISQFHSAPTNNAVSISRKHDPILYRDEKISNHIKRALCGKRSRSRISLRSRRVLHRCCREILQLIYTVAPLSWIINDTCHDRSLSCIVILTCQWLKTG